MMETLNHAQRKAKQRAEKRAAGYKEISVWVRPDQADKIRDYADSLPKPSKADVPGQGNLLDLMGKDNG